jgi:hypothetical protein
VDLPLFLVLSLYQKAASHGTSIQKCLNIEEREGHVRFCSSFFFLGQIPILETLSLDSLRVTETQTKTAKTKNRSPLSQGKRYGARRDCRGSSPFVSSGGGAKVDAEMKQAGIIQNVERVWSKPRRGNDYGNPFGMTL